MSLKQLGSKRKALVMATSIGIISDTHGTLSDSALALLAEVDHIIHAGDIGGPDILRMLSALAPTTAVLGNNDFDEYGSSVGRFAHPVIDGVRFLVCPNCSMEKKLDLQISCFVLALHSGREAVLNVRSLRWLSKTGAYCRFALRHFQAMRFLSMAHNPKK